MFGNSISEKATRNSVFAFVALFLVLAVFYFLPVSVPHKIAFPLAVASVFSFWLIPVQMSLAMVFSAFGDYFGSCGNFIAQMESFAVAHLFIILFFVYKLFRAGRSSRKSMAVFFSGRRIGYLVTMALAVILVTVMAVVKIVPEAPAGVIRAGVTCYIFIISMMLFTALLQRSVLYALGAVLFVFSDFVLAWNKFVEPLQYEDYLIMVPYYAAQLLLFLRSTKLRVGPSILAARF